MAWMWWLACRSTNPAVPTELATLSPGDVVEGFAVQHLYVDEGDTALGARLTHEHTGFGLALLRMRTVPQGYLWVETVPVSDRGEPHTQEHLLLGKGNRGRAVSTAEDMSLVSSSAFTQNLRTVYHFHTTAGPDVYFDVLDQRLGALLFPDYTDEEIRREVHHYGVRDEPDGSLALEEKGTVYNEMDSSFQQPGRNLWRRASQDLYGIGHPSALSAGGVPAAIRTMTPEHIRSFHAATHALGNMAMIAVLPPDVPLTEALDRFDTMLRGHQPEPTPKDATFATEATLPPPSPAENQGIVDVAFPNGDPQAPGSVMLAYPPTRDLSPEDHTLISLLLSGLAGNDSANLYRVIVDSETRERDTGATSVWSYAPADPGFPVFFGVMGIPGSDLSNDDVQWLRDRIVQELRDVAALSPGDPALVDLLTRVKDRAVSMRRGLRKSTSSPPRFGFRGTGSSWFNRIREIDRGTGSRRSLTLADHWTYIDAELATPENPYATHLARIGLLDDEPFVYANRPDPALLAALADDKTARLAAETEAIAERLGIDDVQTALSRFREAYDADTAELESAKAATQARFIDNPPVVLDPTLAVTVRGEGPTVVTGRFDAMTGANVNLAMSLAGLDDREQRWLAVLPSLMTRTGVIIDGTPLSHIEVRSRLQREVLSAGAYLQTEARTGRLELTLYGSGTNAAEVDAAIGWAARFFTSPDWRTENLPRIRDLLDQSLSGLQQRMLGREESWVDNPQGAWVHGDQPAQLHAWSFLTQAHDVLRLVWRLADPGSPAAQRAARRLAPLGERHDREALRAILRAVGGNAEKTPPRRAREVVRALERLNDEDQAAVERLAGHLERALADIPDESLAGDFAYLVDRLVTDWAEAPTEALAELEGIREKVTSRDSARVVATGGGLLDDLDVRIAPLLGLLTDDPAPPPVTPGAHRLRARVAARGGDGEAVHVGLFDPNRRSGVHMHRTVGPSIEDPSEPTVLDFLAAKTWAGGGAHGLFMSTWGAGLAYSNGLRMSLSDGTKGYYAERCPSLGQTMDFVVDELSKAEVTPAIAEYAIAQVFWTREANGYESRTQAFADDLVDGRPPEQTAAFRRAVLALRNRPDLAETLQARLSRVYGQALPGLGAEVPSTFVGMVIGDEAQLDGWDTWLQARDEGTLQRIYPRDFWLTAP